MTARPYGTCAQTRPPDNRPITKYVGRPRTVLVGGIPWVVDGRSARGPLDSALVIRCLEHWAAAGHAPAGEPVLVAAEVTGAARSPRVKLCMYPGDKAGRTARTGNSPGARGPWRHIVEMRDGSISYCEACDDLAAGR